jgi:hypothetical protein
LDGTAKRELEAKTVFGSSEAAVENLFHKGHQYQASEREEWKGASLNLKTNKQKKNLKAKPPRQKEDQVQRP